MLKKVMHNLFKLSRHNDGSISVELALIATALFFAALPLGDLVTRMYNGQQLSSAVRAGMTHAMKNGWDTSGVETAVTSNSGSLNPEGMEVDTDEFCECNGAISSCDEVCEYGMQTFLTVSASYTQNLFVDYPGYGDETIINRSLTVRVE